MRSLDTNVLVRLFTRDDQQQFTAARFFLGVGAWVSHAVLLEFAWVLRHGYDFSHEAIADVIEELLNQDRLVIQEPDVVTAALTHYRAKPSLGLADCMILEIARKAGHLPLGTFDRNLAKIDGAEKL